MLANFSGKLAATLSGMYARISSGKAGSGKALDRFFLKPIAAAATGAAKPTVTETHPERNRWRGGKFDRGSDILHPIAALLLLIHRSRAPRKGQKYPLQPQRE